jgi:2-iminobutanoate/2-iminopropanoate deaminase
MAEISDEAVRHPLVTRPKGAKQHVTAGPYSPVLEVDATRLVVISGQVAIDMEGAVIGDTIEEQTRVTLNNCAAQLASAACTLGNVFKVNIYLTDLGHWARFNAVYEEMMVEPLPVRTAVQAVLLPGFLVEIEMWAVKSRIE